MVYDAGQNSCDNHELVEQAGIGFVDALPSVASAVQALPAYLVRFAGERSEEVHWQMRVLKDVFNFSRGVFLKGASGAAHTLLLELQEQSEGRSYRPRHLHLLHCTCVHPDFLDVASKVPYWQGPEQGAEVQDVPMPPRH